MKKSTGLNQANTAYWTGAPNKDIVGVPGGNYMEDIIIDGGVYRLIVEDGVPTLLRFNEQYGVWVKLKFKGSKKDFNLEDYIIKILKSEYLRRVKDEISNRGF
jgi:hypothetical protein